MAIPSGWGTSAALDTPVYFYSSRGQQFIQAAIPEGGAVIAVAAHDTGLSRSATTPLEWAVAGARAFG